MVNRWQFWISGALRLLTHCRLCSKGEKATVGDFHWWTMAISKRRRGKLVVGSRNSATGWSRATGPLFVLTFFLNIFKSSPPPSHPPRIALVLESCVRRHSPVFLFSWPFSCLVQISVCAILSSQFMGAWMTSLPPRPPTFA